MQIGIWVWKCSGKKIVDLNVKREASNGKLCTVQKKIWQMIEFKINLINVQALLIELQATNDA